MRTGRKGSACINSLISSVIIRGNLTVTLAEDNCIVASPMVVELPNGNWQTQAPGARVEGQRVTFQPPVGSFEISPVQ